MFPILFMEYRGENFIEYSSENILEYIHSSCSIGLLRKKKKQVQNDFLDNTLGYCVLIRIANFKLFWSRKKTVLRRMETGNWFYVEKYVWIECSLHFHIFGDTAFWNKRLVRRYSFLFIFREFRVRDNIRTQFSFFFNIEIETSKLWTWWVSIP